MKELDGCRPMSPLPHYCSLSHQNQSQCDLHIKQSDDIQNEGDIQELFL